MSDLMKCTQRMSIAFDVWFRFSFSYSVGYHMVHRFPIDDDHTTDSPDANSNHCKPLLLKKKLTDSISQHSLSRWNKNIFICFCVHDLLLAAYTFMCLGKFYFVLCWCIPLSEMDMHSFMKNANLRSCTPENNEVLNSITDPFPCAIIKQLPQKKQQQRRFNELLLNFKSLKNGLYV